MISPEELHRDSGEQNLVHQLNRHLGWLLGVTILVYVVGIFLYADRFPFWTKAFSHIGTLTTGAGRGNTASMLTVSLGMMACSWICLRSSRIGTGQFDHYCFMACSAGYLLLGIPCDLLNTVHSIGGALVVGSMWFFCVFHLNELYHSLKPGRFWLYHLLLQGTVLPYAFLYIVGSPADQYVQKIAIAGLIITLKLIMQERIRIPII